MAPKDSAGWSTRIAARLLRLFFSGAEAEEVVEDLRELSADRGAIHGEIYFWVELTKYPLRSLGDWWRFRAGGDGVEREGSGMEGLWKDTRYAVRSLVRSAGFTGMVVSILALSMGATTAIISVVKGVLLDPLPMDEPERLNSVWLANQSGDRGRMTPANFVDLLALTDVFEHVAAFGSATASLTRNGEPLFLRGGAVTPQYFQTLGVRPLLGRGFMEADSESDAPRVVVLSHALWQQAFGSDPSVVGTLLEMGGASVEVVGVAPPGIFPAGANVGGWIPFTTNNQQYFVPLRYSAAGWANRRSHLLGTIVRLRPEISQATATAALETLSSRFPDNAPFNRGEHLVSNPFMDEVVGDVRFALMAILGTVGLVLLIAIVNVGALFVLRSDDRQSELDIRIAMGAPWGRLLRQLLLESAIVVGVASTAAVLVAGWAMGLMRQLVPYQIPRLAEVGIDGVTLAWTLGMGLALALGFGLFTAVRANHSGRGAASRHATSGVRQRRVQGGVIAVQASLGVIVLVGAMLLTRSFIALRAVDPGFAAMETWVLTLETSGSSDGASLGEVLERVRVMPGVAAAALTYDHPLQRNWGDGFRIQGVEVDPDLGGPGGSLRPFGEGYFTAAGIDVVEGRAPNALDLSGAVAYAVVNESLRDTYFPNGDAVGSIIEVGTARRMFGEDAGAFEIMGVVRDVRFLGPETPSHPAFYLPLTHFRVGGSTLLVRPERPDLEVLSGVRQIIRETDASLAIQGAQQLQDLLDDLLARPRFNMMLLVSFAVMGLVLCGLGAYGLMGRVVVMRFREIGIRVALGADNRSLARSIMGSALRPMLLGGVVGIAVALGAVRLLESLLFEVSPGDPLSFIASPIFILAVGILAAVIPTRRAISIDPAQTLRNE